MSLKDYLLNEIFIPAILTLALLFSLMDCSSLSGDHAREMPKFPNDPVITKSVETTKSVELEKPKKAVEKEIQVVQQSLDHFNEDLDIIIEGMKEKEKEK